MTTLVNLMSWLYGVNPVALVTQDVRDQLLGHLIQQATEELAKAGYALHEWKLHSRPSLDGYAPEVTFEAIGVKRPEFITTTPAYSMTMTGVADDDDK